MVADYRDRVSGGHHFLHKVDNLNTVRSAVAQVAHKNKLSTLGVLAEFIVSKMLQ